MIRAPGLQKSSEPIVLDYAPVLFVSVCPTSHKLAAMPTLDFKGKSFVYAHHLSVPFRELVVDSKKSLPAKGQKPSLDDNLIIHGDSLHALKALLSGRRQVRQARILCRISYGWNIPTLRLATTDSTAVFADATVSMRRFAISEPNAIGYRAEFCAGERIGGSAQCRGLKAFTTAPCDRTEYGLYLV